MKLDGQVIAAHSLYVLETSLSQRRYLDFVQLQQQINVMMVTMIIFDAKLYYYSIVVSRQLSDCALTINNYWPFHRLSRVRVCRKQD